MAMVASNKHRRDKLRLRPPPAHSGAAVAAIAFLQGTEVDELFDVANGGVQRCEAADWKGGYLPFAAPVTNGSEAQEAPFAMSG